MDTTTPGRRRPGPVYDDAMKILADDDLGALLSVVGVAGERAERLNVELPGGTMKADLLARTPDGIVHVEFVKDASGSPSQRASMLAAAAELITAHADPDRRDALLGAAATLASIVFPRRIITAALKEAAMPVPVRDTPLGRELYEEGRQDGRQEGRQEGARRSCA